MKEPQRLDVFVKGYEPRTLRSHGNLLVTGAGIMAARAQNLLPQFLRPTVGPAPGLGRAERRLRVLAEARNPDGAQQPLELSARLAALTLLFWAPDASSYIDPNTGGFLFQVLFPIVVAALAGFVFLRDKIMRFIRRLVAAGKEAREKRPSK